MERQRLRVDGRAKSRLLTISRIEVCCHDEKRAHRKVAGIELARIVFES